MARLPISGSDEGTWGTILNDFLSVEHNNDGTLKASGTIADKADATSVVHNTGNETIAGIKTFSASPLVPAPTTNSQAATKLYVDTVATSGAPDATTSNKGIVQLAGDLAGTATAPTVPGLAGKANTTTTISAGTGLTGGGDLSTNRTLTVSYGASAGTAAQGNDSRITGAVQSTIVDAKGDLIVASAADTIIRLPVGSNNQVLTADSAQTSGVKWATPSSGGSIDPMAARYGCKALTFSPHDVSLTGFQEIAMADQRLFIFWLPLSLGTTVTGVRLPIADIISGAGTLVFTVYQEDLSQLGTTGDVRNAYAAGSVHTWRTSTLIVPAATTGSGIWLTALSNIPSGSLRVLFSSAVDTQSWIANPSDRKTALRIEGVVLPPATLDISSAIDYTDFMVGVY